MQDIRHIVCFDLPETQADDLIEATRSTPFSDAQWIVFGRDMRRLGGLVAHWKGRVDVTVILLPTERVDLLETALLILERESARPSRGIWLQGSELSSSTQAWGRSAHVSSSCETHDALLMMERLAAVDAKEVDQG